MVELFQSEREDRSSEDEKEKKNSANEDDDTEWNKYVL